MRERRTKIDWSKHEVIKTEADGLLIHHLVRPDTIYESVKFINTQGIMAVTGDFGNWIFCREFHPSKDGSVSDGYWAQKLRIASTQESSDYDPDATEREIKQRLFDEEISPEEREYYNGLLDYVHENETMYLAEAHGSNLPHSLEHEDVPFCKTIKPWLAAVFDAFDEICSRM